MDMLPKIWLKRPNLQVADYLPWRTKWFTSPWFHWLYKGILCWLWEARHLKQALQSTLRTWLMQQCKAWCIPWLRYMHSHPWTLDTSITVCCKHAVIGWSKFRWPTNPICLAVCKLQSISTRMKLIWTVECIYYERELCPFIEQATVYVGLRTSGNSVHAFSWAWLRLVAWSRAFVQVI